MTSVSLMVNRLQWLSEKTFEVYFQRPPGFDFIPGQKVNFEHEEISREYTLVNAPGDAELTICVRHLPEGRFSPVLASSEKGDRFLASDAYGHFVYQSAQSPAVFVATGTGVAPFVSFARSGYRRFYLLHGVQTSDELYYRSALERAAHHYVPCLSQNNSANLAIPNAFKGQVTDYLESKLPNGIYDFYLCGRSEMVADATRIIDTKFNGSKVFAETFY